MRAIAHDRELLLARVAAAEAVGGVGEPVLVQRAGDQQRRRHRQRRRRPGEHHELMRQRISDRADQPDHEARERKRPGGLRQIRPGRALVPRQRQPCQEMNAGGEFADPRPEPLSPFAQCSGCHRALARAPRASNLASLDAKCGRARPSLLSTVRAEIPLIPAPDQVGGKLRRESRGWCTQLGPRLRGDERILFVGPTPMPPFASFADLRAVCLDLPGGHPAASSAVAMREDTLTKPPKSLGRLEEITAFLAHWQGHAPPRLERTEVLVFAGNHGVTAQGVSAYPAEVTGQMVANFSAWRRRHQPARARGRRVAARHSARARNPHRRFHAKPGARRGRIHRRRRHGL